MATATSHNVSEKEKNNLELYLNEVYEKECVFKIDQEEVDFIQTGIETLVQKLVDQAVEDTKLNAKIYETWCRLSMILSDDLIQKADQPDEFDAITYESLRNILNPPSGLIIHKSYFHLPDDSSLHKYKAKDVDKIPTGRSSVIRVGSFYDRTRNSFPDEFDFIVPLLDISVDNSLYLPTADFCNENFDHSFKTKKEILRFPTHCEGRPDDRQLTYKAKYPPTAHGPAYQLQFNYFNGYLKRNIHVDIVPALRIIDVNSQQWFVDEINSYVEPKTFREKILSAKNCLIVENFLTFTELENDFMTCTLSKKHIKVNRILKYLLNGHGDNEALRKMKDCYCSYNIKVMMIYHHDDCEHADTEDLAPCVLDILEELSTYKEGIDFHCFTWDHTCVYEYDHLSTMNSYLQLMKKDLHEMQYSEDSYDYERNKQMSVAKQYFVSIKEKESPCCRIL